MNNRKTIAPCSYHTTLLDLKQIQSSITSPFNLFIQGM